MLRKLLYTFFAIVVCAGVTNAQLSTYNFSATTGGASAYVPITGGTSPSFTGTNFDAGPGNDEGYANGVPIGFTFRYLGTNYTTLGVCSNGFAYFGASFTASSTFYTNNLATGFATSRPFIAPLWTDLDVQSTSNIKYITTGVAPTRVFTLEWGNAKWDYSAPNAAMSFQMKLYETSNIIEFYYRQEAGAVVGADGASIGLSATATGTGNISSLNNSGTTPTPSTTTETTSIVTKPASGQIYRWDPTYCAAGGTSVSTIGEKIANVTFNTINNSSTSFAQYENFTNLITSVNPGSTYTLNIALNANAYGPDETKVFIDYNGNGVFTDPGETVFTGAGAGPFTTTITIPLTAPLGIRRMRVRLHDTSDGPNATSCGFAAWGQVEDYTLNVQDCAAAAVSTQPANTSICEGNNGTISLSAAGNGITYLWQVSTDGGANYAALTNTAPYSGVTTNTLTITGATTGLSTNRYRVLFGGTCTPANTFSNAAILTVNAPPTVTTPPANKSVCDGNGTSFSVTGTGAALAYQWQVSTDGGTSFGNVSNTGGITGATTNQLTIAAAPLSWNGRQYRCVLTVASCTALNSAAATLTVNALPTVTLNAAPYTKLYPGLVATLTATSTPAANNVYTWYKNGAVVVNATSNTLSVDVDALGSYTATATDANTCTGPLSGAIVISDSVSSKLWIYPNPNNGQFQVRYYSLPGNTLARTLNIFDGKGARVATETYTIGAPYGRLSVDLSNHGKGIYMVELLDALGKRIAVGRAIVQ
jgi:hypothetical protein